MKKDRIVIKDYTFALFTSGMIGFFLTMVFFPLITTIIRRYLGNDFSVMVSMEIMGGTVDVVSSILAITNIVLGALVLQYMRLYMFMGLTRDRAFVRILIVEAVSMAFSFVLLLVFGVISRFVAGNLVFSELLKDILMTVSICVFFFGIGALSSALSTTCRPPLSIAVVAAAVISLLFVYDKILMELLDSHIFFTSGAKEAADMIITTVYGLILMLLSYGVYKLSLSQMKSTSLS